MAIIVSTGLVPVEGDREMGLAILLSPALCASCWVLGRELAAFPAHTWRAVGWIRNSHGHRASSKQPSWLNTHTRSRYQCNCLRARNATDGNTWQGHKVKERNFLASWDWLKVYETFWGFVWNGILYHTATSISLLQHASCILATACKCTEYVEYLEDLLHLLKCIVSEPPESINQSIINNQSINQSINGSLTFFTQYTS